MRSAPVRGPHLPWDTVESKQPAKRIVNLRGGGLETYTLVVREVLGLLVVDGLAALGAEELHGRWRVSNDPDGRKVGEF